MLTLAKCIYSYCFKYLITYRCVFVCLCVCLCVCVCAHGYLTISMDVFTQQSIVQAIYAIAVYFFLSWRTLLRKQQSYSPKDDVIPLQTPPLPVIQQSLAGPVTSSTRNLLSADQVSKNMLVYSVGWKVCSNIRGTIIL